MYSTPKLALVFLYCISIIYGFGYVIFFRGFSPWWWILAAMFCPGPGLICRLTLDHDLDEDDRDSR